MSREKRETPGREAANLAGASIEVERQRTIDVLSQHFAHDNLSLDELERRIEGVYRAASVPALRELTRDLPGADAPAAVPARPAQLPELYAAEQGRIVAIMGETRRRGVWLPPRMLDVWTVMSDTHLDLTEAQLAEGVTEIDLRAIMSSVKVIVPPGVRVVVQVGSFMGAVHDDTSDPPPLGSHAPVVRLSGWALMSEVRVRVRHRERSH